MALRF
jgi:hypothetical protein